MDRKYAKIFATGAAVALAATSLGATAVVADNHEDGYVIGMTNTIVGNGWREEMRCSILAQAAVSGQVAEVKEFHQDAPLEEQVASIDTFITDGVDAIIVNPANAAGLDDVIKRATDAGIVVISVDQAVTAPTAYSITNDHVEYARLGADWLFNHLGGEGDVYYMRGAAGAGADDDRDAGFRAALENYPGINIVQEDHTGWNFDNGYLLMTEFLSDGSEADGVWTSGIDFVIANAYEDLEIPPAVVVGADSAEFVSQLTGPEAIEGYTGAFVTNPASIGGAGVTLALQILNGELPMVPESAESAVVTITPELYENASEEGAAAMEAKLDPDLPSTWPVGITNDFTTYTKEELLEICGL